MTTLPTRARRAILMPTLARGLRHGDIKQETPLRGSDQSFTVSGWATAGNYAGAYCKTVGRLCFVAACVQSNATLLGAQVPNGNLAVLCYTLSRTFDLQGLVFSREMTYTMKVSTNRQMKSVPGAEHTKVRPFTRPIQEDRMSFMPRIIQQYPVCDYEQPLKNLAVQ